MVTKVFCRGYEARLHRDPYLPDVYHYTISLAGDAHILAWGQESSREAAELAAEDCIRDLAGAPARAA